MKPTLQFEFESEHEMLSFLADLAERPAEFFERKANSQPAAKEVSPEPEPSPEPAAEEPAAEPTGGSNGKPKLLRNEVISAMQDLQRITDTATVKEILKGYGSEKLSGIKEADLDNLLKSLLAGIAQRVQ